MYDEVSLLESHVSIYLGRCRLVHTAMNISTTADADELSRIVETGLNSSEHGQDSAMLDCKTRPQICVGVMPQESFPALRGGEF